MDIVIRKLELHSPLHPAEKAALRETFALVREYGPGQDLLKQGERPGYVGALLKGMLRRYKTLPEGRTQTVALPVPGDLFDLHSFTLYSMDHGVGAISRAIVATATHSSVESLIARHPRLGAMLWRETVVEASVFREWVVNCGRTAHARMAHLFCEIFVRMEAVGLAANGGCAFPLTQGQLGEAIGLSIVHVNSVLQQLRAEGLVTMGAGRLEVRDWDGLVEAAGFDPLYLHLAERGAPRLSLTLGPNPVRLAPARASP